MPTGPRRTGRETPPNLRMADNPSRLCANCGFFDGHCNMFDYPVNAGEVCDAWYPEDR